VLDHAFDRIDANAPGRSIHDAPRVRVTAHARFAQRR